MRRDDVPLASGIEQNAARDFIWQPRCVGADEQRGERMADDHGRSSRAVHWPARLAGRRAFLRRCRARVTGRPSPVRRDRNHTHA